MLLFVLLVFMFGIKAATEPPDRSLSDEFSLVVGNWFIGCLSAEVPGTETACEYSSVKEKKKTEKRLAIY